VADAAVLGDQTPQVEIPQYIVSLCYAVNPLVRLCVAGNAIWRLLRATDFTPTQWRIQEFVSGAGGVQQIQLRTEGRENGDLGAVDP
jgi:hypothetical protein